MERIRAFLPLAPSTVPPPGSEKRLHVTSGGPLHGRCMRPDRLYLLDIIEAADRIDVHFAERDSDEFVLDVTRQAAVRHELTVIGEVANRLSKTIRQAHAAINGLAAVARPPRPTGRRATVGSNAAAAAAPACTADSSEAVK